MSTLSTQGTVEAGGEFRVEEPDFDWVVYTQMYRDLRGFKTEKVAYHHWLKNGKREGRVASLEALSEKFGIDAYALLEDFQWQTYLALNPDLRETIDNELQALLHYCQFGEKAGRKYARISSDFDWRFYLWYNSDIKNIASEEEAQQHWTHLGEPDGRLASPLDYYEAQGVDVTRLPEDFDYREYLSLNPYLGEEGITTEWQTIAHFLKRPDFENEAYSYKKLGVSLAGSGRYVEAIAALEKVLKYAPNDLDSFVHLAKALVMTKNLKRATSLYRKVRHPRQSRWLDECDRLKGGCPTESL